jgi:hypothetical protein
MQEEMRCRTREAPLCSWSCATMIQVGRRKAAICHWGVLSGIVLRGWESQPHASALHNLVRRQGEGPDGSTQSAKETRTGHVGLD